MKNIFFKFQLPAILLTFIIFPGCQNYGSNDIPIGKEDEKKADEIYNKLPDTAKIRPAHLLDTANQRKDQMEPENSTGAVKKNDSK